MIKKDMKVAVLGAGAMGCLFGGLMFEKVLMLFWLMFGKTMLMQSIKMD